MSSYITRLPQLSTKRLEALHSMGIHSPNDLLYFFPRRYIDRSNIQQIKNLSGSGEEVTVSGQITKVEEIGFGRKKRLEVTLSDESGVIKGVWFRGASYFKKSLKTGHIVAFFGQVKRYGKHLSIAHPEISAISDEGDLSDFSKIIPIYPANKEFSKSRITSTLVQKWIKILLSEKKRDDFIPLEICQSLNIPDLQTALEWIHIPANHQEHKSALSRFKFEELFLFELSMEKIKKTVEERKAGHVFTNSNPSTSTFFNTILPFNLTNGQIDALGDIKKDVRSGIQMNRLIQGDVGAGKTIVALGAMLLAKDNGFQSVFAAPTEILAEQHFKTLREYLSTLDINIRLLVGGQKAKLRRDILTDIEGGGCDIVVGTHAVFQDQVNFYNLGLAVIDEQHRFGVAQRAQLLSKGNHPHVLVMSATPIPRSLAMTVYADLDVSIIKGLPKGRKPIDTAIRRDNQREDIYRFVDQELADGGQIYIVYPLIEESEALDLKDATAGFEKIKARFNTHSAGLLHGKMPSEEKEAIMHRFKSNEIQILVSTTVIEVGVDVPNASIMIIEHAERFGLSQLHQLRGRIGRGNRQSYCILIPDIKVSKAGAYRLKTMEETNDGFRIAEADLKLRGPGDFLGTKQSGLPDFKVADIVEDQLILQQAKNWAHQVIQEDFNLELTKNSKLKKIFTPYFKEKQTFYGLA